MPVVRNWAALAAAGVCLAGAACNNATPVSGNPAATPDKPKPTAAEIGAPLMPAAKMPELPRPTAVPDPLVIANAVVQFDVKVQIPALVDGQIELIATPVSGPVNAADPLIVYHPRDTEKRQPYRRLREHDVVSRGQTLVRLDEQIVGAQIASSEKQIVSSEKAILAGNAALASYQILLKQSEKLLKDGPGSIAEVEQNRATVARLTENVVQSEMGKAKSEGELLQAQTQMQRYWCKSPVNGRIVKILKTAGEYAKAGDTILEIQSTDRVRVEGKLDAQYATRVKKDMLAVIEPAVPYGPAPFANWHRQEVTAVAVVVPQPGRPLVVSGGLDATALVWDLFGSKLSHRLPHPSGVGVRAVAATAPTTKLGHKVATGCDDGKIRLWDLSNPEKLPKEPAAVIDDGHNAAVTAAAFSPDGKFLATAAGRDVYLWDLTQSPPAKKYALPAEHRDAVTAVRFTPQATLVTVSRDRTVRVWKLGDAGAAVVDPVIDHRNGALDVLGVSADGSRVLFDKDAGWLDVLSLQDGRAVGSVRNAAASARFTGFALFSPDDSLILTAGGDADVKGEMQLWEAPAVGGRGSERRRLVTPARAAVTCAAFSPDKDKPFVVVGTQDGGVHYWIPPGPDERQRKWVGRVEAVLPSDSRSVQVRVVMENPADGGEGLQDRSTATVVINPDAVVAPGGEVVPAPTPRPLTPGPNGALVSPPLDGPKLVGGIATPGGVVRAAGTFAPGTPPAAEPVRASPLPMDPVRSAPLQGVAVPPVAPPTGGGLRPVPYPPAK